MTPLFRIVNLVYRQVEVYNRQSPAGYRSRQDFQQGGFIPVVINRRVVDHIAVPDISR
jgi:hypothetical protein